MSLSHGVCRWVCRRLAVVGLALAAMPASAEWGVTLRNSLDLNTTAIGAVEELSGVTYLGPNGSGLARFAAVQDDDGQVVVFDVDLLADASLASATGVSTITLDDSFDFEGLAFTNPARNSLFVSYEDDPSMAGILPGLREYDLATGDLLQSVALPAPWTTNGNTRSNRGLESLTRTPSGQTMWVANEEALTIDGTQATQAAGTVVRLQRLTTDGNNVAATEQYAYQVEPIHGPTNSQARSGLSDLVALPDGTLLALERSAAVTLPGFLSRIYQVDPSGATDVSQAPLVAGLDSQVFDVVDKTLLFSGGVGGILGSNLEGLALGPQLPSGNWSMVGVVDNGGGATGNLIVAFELTAPSCSLTGDYNCSGLVNAWDYDAWRETFGSTTLGFADGNGDQVVDAADYTVWRDNLGATAPAAFNRPAVPEPTAMLLLLAGLAMAQMMSRP